MILIEEVKRQGQSIGMVVAIGKGKVGYSICHPIEKTNRLGRAVEVAIGRARKRSDSFERLNELVTCFGMEVLQRSKGKKTVVHGYGRDEELKDALERFLLILGKLDRINQRSKRMKWEAG